MYDLSDFERREAGERSEREAAGFLIPLILFFSWLSVAAGVVILFVAFFVEYWNDTLDTILRVGAGLALLFGGLSTMLLATIAREIRAANRPGAGTERGEKRKERP